MITQIRPNRLEISDRFPLLSFTVHNEGGPRVAEVVLATDPSLFTNAAGRTSSSFFSSRELGLLSLPVGNAVYTVPPQILSRFANSNKLWFGLATADAATGSNWEVDVTPNEASPYISLAGLTNKAMGRVRMFPVRGRNNYGSATQPASARLEWAGDAANPGTTPAGQPNGQPGAPSDAAVPGTPAQNGAATPNGGAAPTDVPYDDGFGPLPEMGGDGPTPPVNTDNTENTAQSPGLVSAEALQVAENYRVSEDRTPVSLPQARVLSTTERIALEAILALASGPFLPTLIAARLAARPLGLSVAIGVAGGGGLDIGGSIGGGVIFAPNGDIGLYGLTEADFGAIFSASATVQFTILDGGISAFNGVSQVATISGGEGVVAGLTAIFDSSNNFSGLTIEAGVGIGEPISVYIGIQRSVSTTLGISMNHGSATPPVAISLNNLEIGSEQTPLSAPDAEAVSQFRSLAIQALLLVSPGLNAFALMARAAAELGNVSIGIGPQVSGGLGVGGGFGAGLIFAPGNEMGIYGNVEVSAGWIASMGAGVQLTILKGGIESFDGVSYAATLAGGEGITGGASVIFDAQRNYLGVSLQVGLGVGLSPVEIYGSVQRAVASQMGVAVALGNDSQAAMALGVNGGNERIEIKYRMFIPAPVINGPPLHDDYGGDGRGFSYSGGSARGELIAHIDVTPGSGIANLNTVSRHWGESTAYDSDDTFAVSGKPDWWLDKRSGAAITERETLQASDSNFKIYMGAPGTTRTITSIAENASLVTIYAVGTNPLVFGAPAIDVDISVFVRRNSSGGIEVRAVGDHDGFPAHELYVNGQRIHHYDPVAAGNGPTALFPPSDRDVDTNWATVPALASASGNALELGHQSVQALGGDIPLDPGVGGMSIGMDALEIGDIILSTTNQIPSRLIRFGTGAEVSHAMLYVGQGGQVIESVDEENARGVTLRPLSTALAESNLAVAFRVPGLTNVQKQQIADAAAQHIGRPFNHLGLVRNGSFQIDSAACALLPGQDRERCRNFVGRLELGPGTNEKFFCSQLVMQAFEDAGHRLTTEAAHWNAPSDIARLRLREGVLAYVGHLKAPIPQRSFFGVSLGAGGNIPARSLFNESFTLNWDNVDMVGQPTDVSCWATAGALVAGWGRRQSVSSGTIAELAGSSVDMGLNPSDVGMFKDAIGLTAEPPQSYTQEGFRDLIETMGPLWVAAAVPGLHAIVVTGLYNEGEQLYVRISDPWDRTVGTPGAPGNYLKTHSTGSRYILKWEDFVAEYEKAAIDHASVNLQILHNNGVDGRTPNRGEQTPPGYAQSAMVPATPAPPVVIDAPAPQEAAPTPNAPVPTARGEMVADNPFGPSTELSRQRLQKNGRSYDLAQLKGLVQPATPVMGGEGVAVPGERILLDDWPYIDGPTGRTQAGLAINWVHSAGAIGNIGITPLDGQTLDGWTVSVKADLLPNGESEEIAHVKVRAATTFSKEGVEPQNAVSEVTLGGDGRHETRHGADQAPLDVPPSVPNLPDIQAEPQPAASPGNGSTALQPAHEPV